jgi:arylsulfatase A-like enzyme
MKQALSRRHFLAGSTASLLAASIFGQSNFPRRPNIVFILADDLGYGDLSCYGQEKFQTQNIDRLAAEGIRFTHAYAGSSVCSPSRCALMTGLHTGHCSYRGNIQGEPGISASNVTIAEVLRAAGYRTGIFGKWGLGTVGREGYPTRQGFDRWFGFLSQMQAHDYYPQYLMDNDVAIGLNANVVYGTKERKIYAPDLIMEKAKDWLAEQEPGKPFFLYFPTTLPHANNEKGRDTGDGMEVPTKHPYADKPWPLPERGFAGMMHHLDQQVGQLLAQLKRRSGSQHAGDLYQ